VNTVKEDPANQADQTSNGYKASDIKVLRNLEAVRKRPAMYIGDTGSSGLHHLVEEVVSNSVDEAMAGHCKNIAVTLHEDGSLSVLDDGSGIPVDMHPEEKKPGVEIAMTILHAGAKFDRRTYKVSGGLHGVGVSVVNALSEWLEVEVYRDGYAYYQWYERGVTQCPLEKRGKTKKRGTQVTFKPDTRIFSSVEFNFDIIMNRLRELAYLNPGLRIVAKNEIKDRSEEFLFNGGIKAFVKQLNENKAVLHTDVVYISGSNAEVFVEAALQFNDGYSTTLLSFVNNIHTREGGTHVSGFKSALTRTFNNYARKSDLLKDDGKAPTGDDFQEGMSCVLSIKVPEPQFEGQTKTKLGNGDVQGIVESIVNDSLGTYLEEHPPTARKLIKKAIDASRAREAARKALALARRANVLSSGNLPGKLADCSSRDVESTEVYIVEGDSAGGNAKMARDRRFQAILPIQGKLINVEKARDDKVLNHERVQTIVAALGTGIGGEHFDATKVRYGKIILMADADADGSHIRTLLLTFFYRKMQDLVQQGRIYIAQPPLYRIARKKQEVYVQTEKELRDALLKLGLESTSLEIRGRRVTLAGAQLRELLEILMALGDCEKRVTRRGVTFEEYVAKRGKDGRFPQMVLHGKDELRFFYDEADFKKYMDGLISSQAEEVDADAIDVREFHDSKAIESAFKKIEVRGFTVTDYLGEKTDKSENNRNGKAGDCKFKLISDGESVEVCSLREAADAVINLGRKGLEIQRYKGLGEMNASQLWQTTMNPETRTLCKVNLADAAKAESMFTVLMGDDVESRRQFIEDHALEVKNLDI
jgi:DNA gyrase subunit B